MLTRDSWFTIFTYLNKKQLRKCATVNKEFKEIIHDQKLIAEAPWPQIDYRQIKKSKNDEWNVKPYENIFSLDNGILIIENTDTDESSFYIWKIGDTTPTRLTTHQKNRMQDAISLGPEFFATCDIDNITIWDTHQLMPVDLITLDPDLNALLIAVKYRPNKQQLICIYSDSQIKMIDLQTKQENNLVDIIPDLSWVDKVIMQGNDLFLIHENSSNHHMISVWDIEQATLKKEIYLEDFDDDFNQLISEASKKLTEEDIQIGKYRGTRVITIHSNFIILEKMAHVFLINLMGNKPPLLIGHYHSCQHRINQQNDLVILNYSTNQFHVLAKYDPDANDFMIKKVIHQAKRFERMATTILPDGSIIIVRGEYLQVTKWDYPSQQQSPHFHFEKGLIPNLKSGLDDLRVISLISLPNGDFLSYNEFHGMFAIHDGQTGALKANHYFAIKEEDQLYKTRYLDWTTLANGDLAMMRRLLQREDGVEYQTKQDIKVCRFGLKD